MFELISLFLYLVFHCSNAFGMESGKISDDQISASSSFYDGRWQPRQARQNNEDNAWTPGEDSNKEYIQVSQSHTRTCWCIWHSCNRLLTHLNERSDGSEICLICIIHKMLPAQIVILIYVIMYRKISLCNLLSKYYHSKVKMSR